MSIKAEGEQRRSLGDARNLDDPVVLQPDQSRAHLRLERMVDCGPDPGFHSPTPHDEPHCRGDEHETAAQQHCRSLAGSAGVIDLCCANHMGSQRAQSAYSTSTVNPPTDSPSLAKLEPQPRDLLSRCLLFKDDAVQRRPRTWSCTYVVMPRGFVPC